MSRKTGDVERRKWEFKGFLNLDFGEDVRTAKGLFPEVLNQILERRV
jgi:hypothetical protein